MTTTQYTGGQSTTNTDRLFWFKHLHLAQFLVLALAREFQEFSMTSDDCQFR